jgi:hypothetical protein
MSVDMRRAWHRESPGCAALCVEGRVYLLIQEVIFAVIYLQIQGNLNHLSDRVV